MIKHLIVGVFVVVGVVAAAALAANQFEDNLARRRTEYLAAKKQFDAAAQRLVATRDLYAKAVESAKPNVAPKVVEPHDELLTQGKVRVISARYGAGDQQADVTKKLQKILNA